MTNPDRTVLMLTHAFPPLVAASCFRVMRFARFLPEFGWRCIVLAPAEHCCAVVDRELLKRVTPSARIERFRCGDPAEHLKKWLARPHAGGLRWTHLPAKVLLRCLQSLLIPDTRVISLRRPYRAAVRLIRGTPVQAIWVTGPPFSFFHVGLHLKREWGVPLVLDLRDPWTTSPLRYQGRMRWALGPEERREREVFEAADRIIINTPLALDEYRAKYPDLDESRWEVITNGFDPEEFAGVRPEVFKPVTLVHAGMTGGIRTARYVIEAMGKLRAAGAVSPESFRLVTYGEGGAEEHEAARVGGVQNMVEFRGSRAHHEVLAAMKGAAALLLLVGKGHETSIPGKLYEYLASGRPVIMSGPMECDAARIVRQTGVGPTVAIEDVNGLAAAIRNLVEGRLSPADRDEAAIRSYESRSLSGRLAAILTEVAAVSSPAANRSRQGSVSCFSASHTT